MRRLTLVFGLSTVTVFEAAIQQAKDVGAAPNRMCGCEALTLTKRMGVA
jgi:hypothetical protein